MYPGAMAPKYSAVVRAMVALGFLAGGLVATQARPAAGGPIRVAIDAGHGGLDSGAAGNGLLEKDLNLDIALRLRDLLVADTADTTGGAEWEVLLTRTSDTAVSLQERVDLANNWPAERFVSIHHNGFSSPSANGTETFSFANGTLSADLRDRTQAKLLIALGLTNRGPKIANFFVLRETNMPAALSEGGFITNPGDAAVLGNPAARQASAEAHLFALQEHYGYAAHLPVNQPDPQVYCSAKINSAFCIPTINVDVPPAYSSIATVRCDEVIEQQFGLMLWSRDFADTPFFGGRLCLGGALNRTAVTNSGGPGSGGCQGVLEFQITPSWMVGNGIVPGDEIFVQWWYRDPRARRGSGRPVSRVVLYRPALS